MPLNTLWLPEAMWQFTKSTSENLSKMAQACDNQQEIILLSFYYLHQIRCSKWLLMKLSTTITMTATMKTRTWMWWCIKHTKFLPISFVLSGSESFIFYSHNDSFSFICFNVIVRFFLIFFFSCFLFSYHLSLRDDSISLFFTVNLVHGVFCIRRNETWTAVCMQTRHLIHSSYARERYTLYALWMEFKWNE